MLIYVDSDGPIHISQLIKRRNETPLVDCKHSEIAVVIIRGCYEKGAHSGMGITMTCIRCSGF